MNNQGQGVKLPDGWLQHDGGPKPTDADHVDLIWGIGVIERQPSERVNWSFRWTWRPCTPAGRAALEQPQ
jgi:hypothetical protein